MSQHKLNGVKEKLRLRNAHQYSILRYAFLKSAIINTFIKLSPWVQTHNPVIFVVYIGSILTTLFALETFFIQTSHNFHFIISLTIVLWFTVLFANFAEAVAEGHGKAQAAFLRNAKKDILAKKIFNLDKLDHYKVVPCEALQKGDLVIVAAGELVPADGEIIVGAAAIDESAITGESSPVIREAGGDANTVTAGTKVISDWIVVKVHMELGESFLDKMISMIEGAKRQKTPNEIALTIFLVAVTLIFLLSTITLFPFSWFGVRIEKTGLLVTIPSLIALLVCLIPTTIGGLLSAVGIAGMSRMLQAGIIATSGHAVEAAGDIDIMLLDKTGTITFGNRQAVRFLPLKNITEQELAEAALTASLADETPEGRSIVILAAERFHLPKIPPIGATVVPFTAYTRMSGIDIGERHLRKGAVDAIRRFVTDNKQEFPAEAIHIVEEISRLGSTPLVVIDNGKVLGVIELKDIIKKGIKERFTQLRKMGVKTILVTGDNPLTATAIAAEAGVDDFIAQATPATKLNLIRQYQAEGKLVAMTGDGTNDAPALAQADVAVAMNSGTQAAKEASNMVDLDSDPAKLIEVIRVGKQLLMTRGSLTTFSISNDIAKYFAIIPAALSSTYPQLKALNIMHLNNPNSAILSAVIFNALIIIFLIPLALKGVKYRSLGAVALLRRNLLYYGIGGIIVPFVGIKIIDVILGWIHWV